MASTLSGHVYSGITLGTGTYSSPLTVTSTGEVYNFNGSVGIFGSASQAWTVINQGRVNGYSIAIQLQDGGFVSNSGRIVAYGNGGIGVSIAGATGTVTNSGTITGTVKLAQGGTVVNSKQIYGGVTITAASPVAGFVTNSGTGTISGGVTLGYGGTVTNSGLITNSSGSQGTAISFGRGFVNRLILYPTETIVGTAYAPSFATSNNLELHSATSNAVGTLSGLGISFVNFGTITVDSGAAWDLTGSNPIPSGITLTDSGRLTLASAGTISSTDKVQLSNGSLYDNSGISIGAGASLSGFGVVDAPLSGSGTIVATGGQLELGGGVTSGPSLVIASGATLAVYGAVTAASAISSPGGNLRIGSGANLTIAVAQANPGFIRMFGGTLSDSAGINLNGGAVIGYGTVAGPISGSGSIDVKSPSRTGGTLELTGAVQNGARAFLYNSNTLRLDSSVAAGTYIRFLYPQYSGGTLLLTDFVGQTLTGFSGTIASMGESPSSTRPTTGIDLRGVTKANVTYAAVSGSSIVVKEGASTVATLQLNSTPGPGTYVDWISDGSGGTEVFLSSAACFCRGTCIRTPSGEKPVEELAIGDAVMTLSGAARPVRWIGHRAYDGRFVAGNRQVLPICVTAGALADGVPARDLYVSPEHALVIDGLFLPARLLVNGLTIRQVETVDRLEYFHIELDTHDVIFADGAAAESFVDFGGRNMFHNAGEFAALYPGAVTPDWTPYAALLERGKAGLPAVRAALLERAALVGPLCEDPDLHLIVDGEIIRPAAIQGRIHRFAIPAGSSCVCFASRSSVPAEIDPASCDGRRLGVPVERIVLTDGELRTEIGHRHPILCDGFHGAEPGHRWTDGLGRLPESLLRPFPGTATLELHLAASALRYRCAPTPARHAAA